jgi:hypothetical protein
MMNHGLRRPQIEQEDLVTSLELVHAAIRVQSFDPHVPTHLIDKFKGHFGTIDSEALDRGS